MRLRKAKQDTLTESDDRFAGKFQCLRFVHGRLGIAMASKPIINFHLQNAINSDPVFGNPAFCWRVSNQREFATVLQRMRTMTEGEFNAGRNKAIDFVHDYFYPPSANCIRKFLDTISTFENRVVLKLITTS